MNIRRKVPYLLLLSVIGGLAGAYVGSLLSYWQHPESQYDFTKFLVDLGSSGAFLSAMFVWLFWVPIFLLLLFLSARLLGSDAGARPILFFLVAPFLLVITNHLSSYFVQNSLLQYAVNTILFLAVCGAIMFFSRHRTRAASTES